MTSGRPPASSSRSKAMARVPRSSPNALAISAGVHAAAFSGAGDRLPLSR
ncbi:hypothetical protein [Amycolatopsis sp.]|nr:hypothetical protein [Amycolatopsis sp.]